MRAKWTTSYATTSGVALGALRPRWPWATRGSSLLPVGRQHAPGVSGADTHQRGRLIQGRVLRQQAVENLESRLFFGSQCHILHGVNVTFMLAC